MKHFLLETNKQPPFTASDWPILSVGHVQGADKQTHSHLNSYESRAINCKIVLTYDSLPRETVATAEQALAVVSVTDRSSMQLVTLVVPQLTAMPADPPSLSVLWASPHLCDSRLLSHFKCISPKQ